MIDLTIQGLAWCWRHGHPVVGLESVDAEGVFWITLSPEDAQALSPLYQGHASGRARIYELVETVVEHLDGQIVRVRLGFGAWGALEATIEIDRPTGVQTIPTHVIDAIVLASRRGLPIHIAEQDLHRIHQSSEPSGMAGDAPARMSNSHDATPEPFRHFIESLDFGQLDPPA